MRQQISHARLRHLAYALFLVLSCALATAKAQTAQPIIPFLDEITVNPTTGVATAYFGYHNPNSTTKTISVGAPVNFFTPLPENRGQIARFLPGVHHYAFAAIFNYHNEPRITWILDGSSAPADSATALAQPQNSIFTYQGRLTDGATAASGTYQMEFALFDAATGGTQIGSKLTNTSVNVSNGLFTVQLNFGSSPFTGADRFLEIAVKRPANAGYTTLAPRQQLTAAPFAIHTIRANSADSLSNACVGCVTSAQIGSVAGSKVTGNVANADNANAAMTAGNVTGVVGVANGGTGSATQNFVDLSTNQNIGGNKTFTGVLSGTFSGDGSGLSNVPGKFPWQVVAGTSQLAQANTGYLLTNANQVTVTLPATPNVGDIVRVSGAGLGGWRISQNAGQSILGASLNLYGTSWTPRATSLGNKKWTAVAASADGTKLVAVVNGGLIYTSTDSGENWTERTSLLGNKNWRSVASSADGNKLVAAVTGGQLYTSSDSGVTWLPRDSSRYWSGVASSASGSKLVAVVEDGLIYTSSDSGQTWMGHAGTTKSWGVVASSADGSKLFAVPNFGKMYASADSGTTWTERPAVHYWQSIASSADGTKLVASDRGSEMILTSTDAGITWTMRLSGKDWFGVSSSADGSRLIAVAHHGQVYISSDAGATWTTRDSAKQWMAVASSADGRKHVAVVHSGHIYTSNPMTTSGPAGYLLGGQFATIELQYLGGGQFLPLSHEGTITGN